MIGAYALGIYPRSPKLVEATRVNDPRLDQLFKEEKKRWIKLQEKHNLTYVADPMLDWDDMFRPFAKVKGIELGALNRFFETNTFYRKLIIKDELDGYGKITANNILLDALPENSAVSIPDPYTFTILNENEYYGEDEYILAVAKMLNSEAQTLIKKGISFIQLNAPAIAYNANNIDQDTFNTIKEAVEKVKSRVKKVYLHLYFGNISKIIDKLLEIKIDGLSIDLINNDINEISEYKFKGLGLGVIDATNTKVEDQRLAKSIESILDKIDAKEVYLCPNTDLEYLPYEFATKKISRLASIAKKVRV